MNNETENHEPTTDQGAPVELPVIRRWSLTPPTLPGYWWYKKTIDGRVKKQIVECMEDTDGELIVYYGNRWQSVDLLWGHNRVDPTVRFSDAPIDDPVDA